MNNCDAQISKIFEAITNELINFVNWANSLYEFNCLSKNDQAMLLYSHAGRHLILSVSQRSLNRQNSLLLNNGCILTRSMNFSIIEMKTTIKKIMDELVHDIRELQIDDTEITNINGMSFFNPFACDLWEREYVKATRNIICESLKNYTIQQKQDSINYPIRFTKILLMLPLLEQLGSFLYDSIENINPFGVSIGTILYNLLNKDYTPTVDNIVKMSMPVVAFELNEQRVAELWKSLTSNIDVNLDVKDEWNIFEKWFDETM